ncbi:MAG: polyprenyl synthetase family protein [Chloroflexi bacterium]|nr:polyprenyl synthetase family protein [Chloroflexota bacterium]
MDRAALDLTARYRDPLRAHMVAAVPAGPPADSLYQMIRYHLGWLDAEFRPTDALSGKLIRPQVCLLAAEATGADFARALDAAAAIELLHNFTLIHDDIQDRSPTRRHRATVWSLWGEALAINVGDALHVLARLALLQARREHPADIVLAAAEILDRCCLGITEGQQLDLSYEIRLDVRVAEYLTMIERKTALLLGSAAQLGALFGTHDAARADLFRRFGEQLGLAFQVQDDILGIWGDEAATGKPAADDLYKRKKTLPVIVALTRADEAARARLGAIYRGPIGPAEVAEILALLERNDARTASEEQVADYTRQSLAALDAAAPDEPAAGALRALAEGLQRRST